MRWKTPKASDGRIIKRFAFLPVEINHEARWLETVYIFQTYYDGVYRIGWDNSLFVTKEEYENYKKEKKDARHEF
jgi:hypothetical protein